MKIALFLFFMPFGTFFWGFFGHQKINQYAIYTLPSEMSGFYRMNKDYLVENAVNPDKRRYAVEGEAPRHYIDWDVYPAHIRDSLVQMPWKKAVDWLSEDTLQAYGIVPWHVIFMKYQLTKAFEERDVRKILRLSAEIGHYIADANVPLHTTRNYNGQETNQYGIHGFWESRLPELFFPEFHLWVGKATYLSNPTEEIWNGVLQANRALDSVFTMEKKLTIQMGLDKKYTVTERNKQTVRAYSYPFSEAYFHALNGQVERQMKRSIKMVGDFWYTAWVDAGQPDLQKLAPYIRTQSDEKEEVEMKKLWLKRMRTVRPEE